METHGLDPLAVRANKLHLVERLADDLAHEIKNPLHSMVINLEVLRRRAGRVGGAEGSDLLRFIGVVSGELDRVTRRIELLLRLVRPDRSGDPAPVAELVEEFLELLELERDRRGVKVEFRPAPHPLHGYLPRERGRQIVLNLLLAGLDRTPRGGRLLVESDGGEGEVELSARVFAPESKSVEDDGRVEMLRALAESMGGSLHLSSGDGEEEGDVLTLRLPSSRV